MAQERAPEKDAAIEVSLKVAIEIAEDYAPEERQQLLDLTRGVLADVDEFLEGEGANIFGGLAIKIGEKVAPGGAETIVDKNMIALNGRAMLMSLAEMRSAAGYGADELLGGSLDQRAPGGALRYTLGHEMGHILDELTKTGDKRHRVAASESPTKYGREADEWNSQKDHEAFAEGFAHLLYQMPVSDELAQAVRDTIRARLTEITDEPK